ncbi:hypothetical protein [Variovorax sp. PBL-E5]|nr:hypothetical protein [Variovorax sp. PBL-E5]VTU23025.1 hypothetical protein E5CHR_01508 [Variovorax sp. PBL-E5]
MSDISFSPRHFLQALGAFAAAQALLSLAGEWPERGVVFVRASGAAGE